ncbi:MAG: hypothetical protein M5U28_23915 [Sandaracinaceae bacterium]|nr:hypothetical protein [Sandaracinaceae bacterium]
MLLRRVVARRIEAPLGVPEPEEDLRVLRPRARELLEHARRLLHAFQRKVRARGAELRLLRRRAAVGQHQLGRAGRLQHRVEARERVVRSLREQHAPRAEQGGHVRRIGGEGLIVALERAGGAAALLVHAADDGEGARADARRDAQALAFHGLAPDDLLRERERGRGVPGVEERRRARLERLVVERARLEHRLHGRARRLRVLAAQLRARDAPGGAGARAALGGLRERLLGRREITAHQRGLAGDQIDVRIARRVRPRLREQARGARGVPRPERVRGQRERDLRPSAPRSSSRLRIADARVVLAGSGPKRTR